MPEVSVFSVYFSLSFSLSLFVLPLHSFYYMYNSFPFCFFFH